MARRRFDVVSGGDASFEVWRVCADTLVDWGDCPVIHLCDCTRTAVGSLRTLVSAWPTEAAAIEAADVLEEAAGPLVLLATGVDPQCTWSDFHGLDDDDVPF